MKLAMKRNKVKWVFFGLIALGILSAFPVSALGQDHTPDTDGLKSETDETAWQRIKNSRRPEKFSDFIARYPQSRFRPEADRKLKELTNEASGKPVEGRWYLIQNKNSGKYLDVTWGSKDNNAPVGQSSHSSFAGGAAQTWKIIPVDDGWHRIQNKNSGKYLDVTWGSKENNAPVGQSDQSSFAGGAAQLWKLIPVGDGWYRIQNKNSGRYLDVTWGKSEHNAPVGQSNSSSFAGGAAQLWKFTQ